MYGINNEDIYTDGYSPTVRGECYDTEEEAFVDEEVDFEDEPLLPDDIVPTEEDDDLAVDPKDFFLFLSKIALLVYKFVK